LAEIAEQLLDGNPRRIKRLLNTYRYIKMLAYAKNEPVHEDHWQENMIAWLAFTMKWPSAMADAITKAGLSEASKDSNNDFLLQTLRKNRTNAAKPDGKDVSKYLNLSAAQVRELAKLAGNFLIENPEPRLPPKLNQRVAVRSKPRSKD
jgi:hypothetical protein